MRAISVTALIVAGLAGCASQPPDWIMRPTAEGGFAATECVKDSGNLSLDRQVAVAKARAEVAKQVELRVAAMDKTYTRLTEETNAPAGAEKPAQSRGLQTAFESVSKQIAEQTLSGLAPARVEYVELNDARNLCAMISIDKSQTRQVYDQIVQTAGAKLAPETSEALYQDFSTPSN
jgi:membrane-bound lytic murein transglycosylase